MPGHGGALQCSFNALPMVLRGDYAREGAWEEAGTIARHGGKDDYVQPIDPQRRDTDCREACDQRAVVGPIRDSNGTTTTPSGEDPKGLEGAGAAGPAAPDHQCHRSLQSAM